MYSIGKNKYRSSAEVAARLGISKASVLRLSKNRTLPYLIHPLNGKYRLYRPQDVEALVRKIEVTERRYKQVIRAGGRA